MMGDPWNIESQSPEQASLGSERSVLFHVDLIQLVESELPLDQITNYDELEGVFLFRQLCAPYSSFVECLFCNKSYPLMRRDGLVKHYYLWHGLVLVIARAKFRESLAFLRAPPDFSDSAILSFRCTLCKVTLENLNAIYIHYYVDHEKEVTFLPQNEMEEKYSSFHCSICGVSSVTFISHCEHLKSVHNNMTYFCKFCMFCASHPLTLCRHLVDHFQPQNGLHFRCPTCSVYLRGTDVLIMHLKKLHAVLIDDSEWCCRHCDFFYEIHEDLLTHLPHCPCLSNPSKTRRRRTAAPHRKSCKCSDCTEDHLFRQEMQKLRDSSIYGSTTDQIGAAAPRGDGLDKKHIVKGTATKNSKKKHPGEVRHCADGMEEESSLSLSEETEVIQKEQPLERAHCSSCTGSELQIICGGCLMYFDTEDQFAQHHCTLSAL